MNVEEQVNRLWDRIKKMESLLDDGVYLSEKDAADFFGVPQTTLRKMRVEENTIPYYQVSDKKILYNKKELEMYLVRYRIGCFNQI